MPANQRPGRDDPPDAAYSVLRYQSGEKGQPCTVNPGELAGELRIPALRDCELVAQNQNLDVFGY